MTEPTGLAGFISLSKEAYARFLAGRGGEAGACVFATAQSDSEALFAWQYVSRTTLEKLEDPTRATSKLVDASLRKLARTVARRRLGLSSVAQSMYQRDRRGG